MPAPSRKARISSTDPKAMKMSSLKKIATLSAAAAWARISQRSGSGRGPDRFSAAASAIGAISGRTIWAWPPTDVSPRVPMH